MMVIGLSMLATSASAFGPMAYGGLYSDEARTVIEYMGTMSYVDVKLWINPSDNGVSVMQYKLDIEGAATVFATATKNPDMGFSSGDLWQGDGIQISCPCQPDWFWSENLNFFVMNDAPSYIVLLPHGLYGLCEVGGCDALKTLEPLNPINKFGLNTLGIVPNETSTWGAIKSLINE